MNTGIHLNGATIMTTPTARHVEIARATGYVGVEVRAERLVGSPGEVDEAAAVVRPGEVWSVNGIQVGVDRDGRLDRERLDRELPPRLEVCVALGAAYLLVVPPREPGLATEVALPAVREGLTIVHHAAGERDVRVAFEFLGFGDCPIDDPGRAAAVVAAVPGADLVVDSCHWHASGSGSLDVIPIERLAMVHLNDAPAKPPREIEDADRVLPGRGTIRLAELVASLRGRGYRGPWSLETFNPAYWELDPTEVARDGREALRALLGE
ncbi:MAG TPA: sugar phosphate isomerase/epimerase [Candidatus Limnocylindrales bacterium]|nr:sugar phosphate isomerase/epimerase [Candidatus Limnocylindrales bacterium]